MIFLKNLIKTINVKNNLIVYIFLAIITVFVTNFTYHFGDNNHIEQLPHIFSKLDPDYLTNDFFVQYTTEINPRYYYSLIVAAITRLIPIEIIFYVFTLIFNYLILIVTYFSVRLLGANKIAGMLTAVILLVYKDANLGRAGAVGDGYLIPQLMAMPLVLFAFYQSIVGGYKRILVAMLFSLIIQPSLTLLFFVPIAVNLIINSRCKDKLVKVGILFLSMFFLTYFLFPNNTNNLLSNKEFISILAYQRAPHHYIPSEFRIEDYGSFFALMILFFSSLIYLLRVCKTEDVARYYLFSGVFSLLMLVVGYIFVEVFPIKQIVALQTFRIVSLLRWMSIVIISAAVFKFAEHKARSLYVSILGAILIVILLITNFKDANVLDSPNIFQVKEVDKQNIYKYVEKNTPRDAIFLTPPQFGDMRIIPRRAIVVDWKSFPFNEKDMASWYERMMDCYGGIDLKVIEGNYSIINDGKLSTLKSKYNFGYAILHLHTETRLNIVYKDNVFKLVKI